MASQAVGPAATFAISLVLSLANVGYCEYKGGECGDAKGIVWSILGVGGGAAGGYAVGYATLNPNLKRPEDDPVKRTPPPRPNARQAG